MTTHNPPFRIFGHSLPASLVDAVGRNTHVPLLEEGWFVASVVWGGAMAALTFLLFGTVFLPGAAHSDPTAARAVLSVALLVGVASGLAGLAVWRWLRGPTPQRRRAVVWHRRMVAALLLLLGLSGLWHAWLFAPLTGLLGLLIFAAALGLGFLILPAQLARLSGQSTKFQRVARRLDRVLLLGIALLGILVVLPPVVNAQPGVFFLVLTQALSLLALPWVAAMLAEARIHARFAAAGR